MSAYRPIAVDSPSPRSASRRALLAGAVGGMAALAATAIGGVTPRRVRGAVGDPLLAGSEIGASTTTSGVFNNSDTNGTWVVTQNGKGTAVRGVADRGTGGRFSTGARNKYGLIASNTATGEGSGAAIQAQALDNPGLQAVSDTSFAVHASTASGIAVYGESTGISVWGVSSGGAGIRGESIAGHGVYGHSTSNYAGYFADGVFVGKHLDMPEQGSDPAAPGFAGGRLFSRDNGSGKSQLAVRFPTGAVQVIATEP